ncbi:organomercurial lyase [Actinoallomurus vinaceus]|uniref:Organomercurial lyase n=1 Tax=Actinoallomurus vinaceus TaxID=1080074 RepID=A0ABP8ULM3_9ACTN
MNDERRLEGLRTAVYATLAEEGRAPSAGELAVRWGRSPEETVWGLRELAVRHTIVLGAADDVIRMAHPFSASPMGFVVSPLDGRDDRNWWGGCAWDSFGISAALGVDVLIDTACPECGRRHRVTSGPERPPTPELTVHFPLPAARWWDDVVFTCSNIRMFCSPDHLAAWASRTGRVVGRAVGAATVWELSRPWYGDRLAPGFRPHTTEHNQRLLTEVGLAGDFWRLP